MPDEPSRLLASPGKVTFGGEAGFQHELRRRVEQYFRTTGRSPRDVPAMYLKSGIVLAWFAASYLLLVLVVSSWWLAVPLAVSLGLSMAAIGFNIQHDGGHRAYSEHGWVNKLAAISLDMLGGSSYVWARKHNSIHHVYTNITGVDDDINIGFLGRLSPAQKRWRLHRLQHYYLWVLYGFLPLKWQLYDDFRAVATGRIGGRSFTRPRGWDLAIFIGGKMVFLTLALGIPLLLHPVWLVLLFYVAASYLQGLLLSVVFQLAHCVEAAAFPLPREDTGRMASTWAAHQVEATVDFSRGNQVLSWLIGGLNYQIEHHLFPQICHLHYPALSLLVEETCEEFGLRYLTHETLLAGVTSHFRWLRRMGQARGKDEG